MSLLFLLSDREMCSQALCCMSERVKAKSCTFVELLRDCFANFKDNVFQFGLRIACERATELHTCFLDAGHRARFYEGVSYILSVRAEL